MNLPSPPRSVILNPNRHSRRLGRHPWILATSIQEPETPIGTGEVVDLFHADGRWAGRGLYNPGSRIRVRLYAWEPQQAIDAGWFCERLDQALALRHAMGFWSPRQALRLIFSEADQLSGLIVDRFGDHLVVQVTAAALTPFLSGIVAHLVDRLRPASLVTHVDAKTAKSEGMEPHSQCWVGEVPSEPVWLEENGMLWGADLREGQKTGYYLDQCENRWAAARWTPPGARVLDVCTYAGGFALTIANRDPTAQVTAIDSSPRALALAQANAEKNGLDQRVKWEQEDFFHALSARVDAQEVYDMVVLDPPRIAGSRDQLARAMSAYHRLNYLAARILRPGGILVTCSCSGRVQRGDFLDMLRGVSGRIRREIQILENRGASPDHPVSIHCPETDYLKCIVARVL